MNISLFWFKFHWSWFLRVQLTICQHWLRLLLGTKPAMSHYLKQWRPRLLTHICISWPEFVLENINIHLHLLSLLNPGKVEVLEILPYGRQGHVFHVKSTSYLMMIWWCKESGHQQPWYWPTSSWNIHEPDGLSNQLAYVQVGFPSSSWWG